MEDIQIVALYLDRNESAISESDRKYGRILRSLSISYVSSREDAEECVNDTYLDAWNTIPPQRPISLGAFLSKITRRISIDRFRHDHRAKRGGLKAITEELTECIPDPDGDPAAAVSSAELRAALNSFVASLEEQDQKLFVGRYWHGYTPRELAKAYGMKENALNQRLFRIRERLRRYLTERGYRV